MATIIIPAALRKFTDHNSKVVIDGKNVKEVIVELTSAYPGMKPHLINGEGNVPLFINIFVDSRDIRNLQRGETLIREESVISIVPAIAGG